MTYLFKNHIKETSFVPDVYNSLARIVSVGGQTIFTIPAHINGLTAIAVPNTQIFLPTSPAINKLVGNPNLNLFPIYPILGDTDIAKRVIEAFMDQFDHDPQNLKKILDDRHHPRGSYMIGNHAAMRIEIGGSQNILLPAPPVNHFSNTPQGSNPECIYLPTNNYGRVIEIIYPSTTNNAFTQKVFYLEPNHERKDYDVLPISESNVYNADIVKEDGFQSEAEQIAYSFRDGTNIEYLLNLLLKTGIDLDRERLEDTRVLGLRSTFVLGAKKLAQNIDSYAF